MNTGSAILTAKTQLTNNKMENGKQPASFRAIASLGILQALIMQHEDGYPKYTLKCFSGHPMMEYEEKDRLRDEANSEESRIELARLSVNMADALLKALEEPNN
jgi:hypothetical protein